MSVEALVGRWGPGFVLLLARCGGLVAFGPVFGSGALPALVKIAVAGALALALAPVLGPGLRPPADALALAAVVAGELAVGALLGLSVRVTLAGIGMAGELASVQMGVGMPATLDPHSLTQVTAVNHLLDQVAVVTFLALDGHHAVLAALGRSLALVPPLHVAVGGAALEALLGAVQAALLLAVRLAAPMSAAILASLVTLGLLNRVAPQVNVFMVSFALTAGIGLLVLLAALPLCVTVMQGGFGELPARLGELLLRMRHGL